MNNTSYRNLQALLLLMTTTATAASFYFQYVLGLEPCPLCLMQRLCSVLLMILCMLGLYVISSKSARLVSFFQLFFSIAGLFFASRQLWLQSLPAEQVPACIPGLDTLIRYFPWQETLRALFWGSGDCAEVSWNLLGFTMPAWAALYFVAATLVSILILQCLRRLTRDN